MNLKQFAAMCGCVGLLTAPAAALASVEAPARATAPGVALAQPGFGAHVTIIDFAFTPSYALVAPGTTVTWSNEGAVEHIVASTQTPGTDFRSGSLLPGDRFHKVLWDQGATSYYCQVHPSMTGTIEVGFLPPMEPGL